MDRDISNVAETSSRCSRGPGPLLGASHAPFSKEVCLFCVWRRPSPVPDEPGVALVDADHCLGVDVEADEDPPQEVASSWTQRSHHVHDGCGEKRKMRVWKLKPR